MFLTIKIKLMLCFCLYSYIEKLLCSGHFLFTCLDKLKFVLCYGIVGLGVSLAAAYRTLRCALHYVLGSYPACARKQGTLSHLFHLWTGMCRVVPLSESDFVNDFRCETCHLRFVYIAVSNSNKSGPGLFQKLYPRSLC